MCDCDKALTHLVTSSRIGGSKGENHPGLTLALLLYDLLIAVSIHGSHNPLGFNFPCSLLGVKIRPSLGKVRVSSSGIGSFSCVPHHALLNPTPRKPDITCISRGVRQSGPPLYISQRFRSTGPHLCDCSVSLTVGPRGPHLCLCQCDQQDFMCIFVSLISGASPVPPGASLVSLKFRSTGLHLHKCSVTGPHMCLCQSDQQDLTCISSRTDGTSPVLRVPDQWDLPCISNFQVNRTSLV